MTLDELANELHAASDEKAVRDLAKYIEEWKGDDRNAEALEKMVERFFGNVWVSKEEEHLKAYGLWSSFRDDAIHGIGGMTMNERLYAFALFERFDSCKSEAERREVYGKVHAKP
ncbi:MULTISPECIES: hypothetical protein [unclassified Microbulbifer]|uniref:hypothetical protein n=1 Tax=unclassified Microbulbifer TaxID=2619833 RepID=UPI0027E3C1E7|nr:MULTISPECIES: hypothetical protein [unclassified Microbulbifer]